VLFKFGESLAKTPYLLSFKKIFEAFIHSVLLALIGFTQFDFYLIDSILLTLQF